MGPSKRELLRIIERERAQHRVEIGNLLDRFADLSGKPWSLPPRPIKPDAEDEIERDYGPLEEL